MAAKDISKNVSHKSNSEFSHNSHTLKDFPDRRALYFCLFIWLASSSRALILMVPPLMQIRNLHLHRSHPMNVTILILIILNFMGCLTCGLPNHLVNQVFLPIFIFYVCFSQFSESFHLLYVQVQGKTKQQKKNKRKENMLLTMPS